MFGLIKFGLVIFEEFVTITCFSLLNTRGLLQAKWRDLAAASERRVASSSPAGPNILTRLPSGSEGPGFLLQPIRQTSASCYRQKVSDIIINGKR